MVCGQPDPDCNVEEDSGRNGEQRLTEPANTFGMSLVATADSTSKWKEVWAQNMGVCLDTTV